MTAKLLLHFFLISTSIACGASAHRVTILYTSEQNGYLEPCGCSQPQLGGLARRRTLIESFVPSPEATKSGADTNLTLVLDNGDISKGFGRQEEIKCDISLFALDEMGYCALNVGEKDIFLGLDYLKGARQNVRFPFISANLFHKHDGRLFRPYVIRSFGEGAQAGINIAIIGIISKEFEGEISGMGGELYIEDPVKTVKEALAELALEPKNLAKDSIGAVGVVSRRRIYRSLERPPTGSRIGFGERGAWSRGHPVKSEVDAIILLAHGSVEEAKRLTTLFPQISLIICGHGRDDPLFEPITVGDTLLVNGGNRGKYVGKVVLTFDEKRRIIKREHEVIELSEEIADSKAVVELLDYYQEILRSEDLLGKAQKEKDKNGGFVGSQSCEACHLEEFLVWKDSKHARAYKTLAEAKRIYDPECVACHTTGFRYESGFRSFEKTPQLVGVGCEDCHGPGGPHIEDTESEYGAVFKQGSRTSKQQAHGEREGERVCVECHNADRSPGFDLDRYWQKVKH